MAKRLDGKVALVTGASSGIGLAITQGLAENGAKVMISSRSEKNVKEAETQLRSMNLDVSGAVCDVSKKEHIVDLVKKCIETYNKIDVVVANAGIMNHFGPLVEMDDKDWDNHMNINVKSGFWLAKETVQHLEKTKGSMIFVSSTMAYDPFKYVGVYSISKTAVLSLVKVLSKELADKHIRVNGINPGGTDTPLAERTTAELVRIANSQGSPITVEQMDKMIMETVIPMKRLGKPSEMAGAVVFLASDEASYITGEMITISGGSSTRL